MKLLYWLLPLVLLFAFTMPAMGADTGPPGDLVIEQGLDSDILPTIEQAVAGGRFSLAPNSMALATSDNGNVNSINAKPVDTETAYNYANLRIRPPTLMTVLSTSDAVQPPFLRLWRAKGGVAFGHCIHHDHPLRA